MYGNDMHSRNIELGTLDLKGRLKKLVEDSRAYIQVMRSQDRAPVVRLCHPDYLDMREACKRLTKVDTFDGMLLDGYPVQSYLD